MVGTFLNRGGCVWVVFLWEVQGGGAGTLVKVAGTFRFRGSVEEGMFGSTTAVRRRAGSGWALVGRAWWGR